MATSVDTPSDVDRGAMWYWWKKNQAWRDKLHHEASRKALDIPEEPMINANRYGLSGLATTAIVAAAALGPIGGFVLANYLSKPQAPPSAVSPADSEYDVIFYDSEGKVIQVPHISQRKAQ